jgi:D-aminopeptidase
MASTTSPAMPVRARDLGVPFEGTPGPLNAITDVAGVRVGHCTLLSPAGGNGVRTGVTTVFPFSSFNGAGVPAGFFAFNGTGEVTGALSIQEFGAIFGPIALTGTSSVGAVRDALLAWMAPRLSDPDTAYAHVLPVVAETYDGDLTQPWTFPIQQGHVFAALNSAVGGTVTEGTVGGGTGMVAYDFKGGIGTSSRQFEFGGQSYTVGALVQTNHGDRRSLLMGGQPVGQMITDLLPAIASAQVATRDGSIIGVIATDAPLLPHQLTRVAKRAAVGLARAGGIGTSTSGDMFIAFSTANAINFRVGELQTWQAMPSEQLHDVFYATAFATEEAILNSLVAATTVTSEVGLTVHALPHDRVRAIFNRLRRP